MTAGVYMSLPLLDLRVEAFVAGLHQLGIPRTETYTNPYGSPGYQMQRARPGWRLGLSPARRLVVAGHGQTLVEVASTRAPQEWINAVHLERHVYVFAGGPVPLIEDQQEIFSKMLGWVCSHPTVGGLMPAVEIP